MSEDNHGLDKAARLAAKQEEAEAPVLLEPEFPFEVVPFDPKFLELATGASE